MKKPYYGVKINKVGSGVELRVNDIPIFSDREIGQINVELPIVLEVLPGVNNIKVIIRPHFLDGSYDVSDEISAGSEIEVTLFVEDLSVDDSDKIQLSNFKLIYSKNKSKAMTGDGSEVTILNNDKKEFSVDVKFDLSDFNVVEKPWVSSLLISNNEETKKSLLSAYKEIYDVMGRKDVSELKDIYREKARLISKGYHLGGVDEGHDKLNTGGDVIDSSLELIDFLVDDMELKIFAGGRLASIQDNFAGAEPIIFLDESDSVHMHKFMFMLTDDDKWVLVN